MRFLKHFTTFLAINAILLANINPAQSENIAPSFDCAKATNEVEKFICSDDELSKLDVEMNNSYYAFMKTLAEEYYRDKLKKKQIDWLDQRDKLSCYNTNDVKKRKCLLKAYQVRIDNLNKWRRGDDETFYIRVFDQFEEEKQVGYRRRFGKFFSKNGEEFYIDCYQNKIFPRLPEEKVYTDTLIGNKTAPDLYLLHISEEFIYIKCIAYSDMLEEQPIEVFDEDEFEQSKHETPTFYSQTKSGDDIIAKLKSKFIDNPKVEGTSSANCKQIWNKLKEEKFTKLTPSVFQSLPKFQNITGMKCKDLLLENDNSLIQMANSIPLSFYNIAGKNILINSNFLGTSLLSTICVLNKNCVCKSLDEGTFDFMTPIIEIDNEYFLLDYIEGLKGKISFSATYLNLNNTENRKQCNFRFE